MHNYGGVQMGAFILWVLVLFPIITATLTFVSWTNWCTPESNFFRVLVKSRFLKPLLPECLVTVFFSPLYFSVWFLEYFCLLSL